MESHITNKRKGCSYEEVVGMKYGYERPEKDILQPWKKQEKNNGFLKKPVLQ